MKMVKLKVVGRFHSLEALTKVTDVKSAGVAHAKRVKNQDVDVGAIRELIPCVCRDDNGTLTDVEYYPTSPIDGGVELTAVVMKSGDVLLALNDKGEIERMMGC